MSLWDKTEYDAIVGTFTGTSGTKALTVSGATNLAKKLSKGDIINTAADGTGQVIVIASVNSDTSVTTATNLTANVSGSVYRKDVPSWVKDPQYAKQLSVLTNAEAKNATFKNAGLTTPGWVRSVTYTDAKGKTRNKSETLATFNS